MLQIFCACCGVVFGVCKACYKGHKYCCGECRKAGCRHAHRKAQATYRRTDKGRKQHRQAEAMRRRKKKNEAGEKSKLIDCVRKTCMCLAMRITELYLNFDPVLGICNCLVCGDTFVIDENCIEIVDPPPD